MATEFRKALIYCRVSSLRQVREGSGLDSQEHRCRQYAKDNGLEIEKVFPDDGISGGLFERPAMKSMIRYLDDNWQENYVVIFDDLKRFARDVDVHRGLKRELKDRGVKLSCLNYTFDDSPEGEFVETVFAAQNELERKQNRRQVCQKMKARMERGYWCFYPPTGYQFTKTKEHGKLIAPIKSVADILAEGLNAFADDRLLNQVDLQRFLAQSRLLQLLNKKKIHFDFVKRVLTEPVYAGIIEYQPWQIRARKGLHKPIITEEVYFRNQEKLRRPERKPRTTDSLEFPLRRIISCAICGKPMTGSTNRGKSKYYSHYTCNNKDCISIPKNITAALVEDQYVEFLRSIRTEQDVLPLIKEIATRLWQDRVAYLTRNQDAIDEEIKAINNEINEYVVQIPKAKTDIVRDLYESRIEELAAKIKILGKGPENKKIPDFEEALQLMLNFIGTPAESWKKANLEQKILLHKLIFTENPTYSLKTGFGTPNLSVPFYIKEHVEFQIYCMVDSRQKIWNTFMDDVLEWCKVLKVLDAGVI